MLVRDCERHADIDDTTTEARGTKKQRRRKALAVKEKVKSEILKKTTCVLLVSYHLLWSFCVNTCDVVCANTCRLIRLG